MKSHIPVFVDSDVIISSLLSSKGAAHLLMQSSLVLRFTSTLALVEQSVVVQRLGLSPKKHTDLIKKSFLVTSVTKQNAKTFGKTVSDPHDAHIVAGAVASKANFLITYNTKDFHTEIIRKSWDIVVITPGFFLQYMRSQSKTV